MSDRSELFIGGDISEGYERYMARQIFEPWARRLVELAKVGEGDRVLDVASGTGIVARVAAEVAGATGSVLASDISPTQLEVCVKKAPPSPPAAPISTLVASAEAIDVEPESFDVALCQQGLQFFPDQAGAVAAMHRALRPGGTVAIAVWATGGESGLFEPLMTTLAQFGVEPPFPNAFDISTFQMQGDEIARLLAAAGFRDVHLEVETVVARWADREEAAASITGTPYRAIVEGFPPEKREELMRRLIERVPEDAAAPSTSNLVRAIR